MLFRDLFFDAVGRNGPYFPTWTCETERALFPDMYQDRSRASTCSRECLHVVRMYVGIAYAASGNAQSNIYISI